MFVMRIRFVLAGCLWVVALFFQSSISSAQRVEGVRIGTGGSAGVYFVAGNAICRMLRTQQRKIGAPRMRCAAPPSGGSINNLKMLRDKEIDFAVVQSDWHFHAHRGTSIFKGNSFADLRSVFSLHVEPFQIVAAAGTGINVWQDLAQKRVNIGNEGSGHRATFDELLAAHNLTRSEFRAVSELTSSEHAMALCAGSIDAFAFTVGVPNASIAQATDGCDGKIIPLDTPQIGQLIQKAPYYRWTVIPEGTYATTENDVKTIGVMATLVTRADVPEGIVRELTNAVFENLPRFQRLHPAFAGLKAADMALVGLSAPTHKGAEAYFRDAGLLDVKSGGVAK